MRSVANQQYYACLDDLGQETDLDEDDIQNPRHRQTNLQIAFLNDLMETSAQIQPDSKSAYFRTSDRFRKLQPRVQGPFCLQPAPVELSENAEDATDILCLATEPWAAILIGYECGKVDVCVEFDVPGGCWVGVS
jgi:hypothetical protein